MMYPTVDKLGTGENKQKTTKSVTLIRDKTKKKIT